MLYMKLSLNTYDTHSFGAGVSLRKIFVYIVLYMSDIVVLLYSSSRKHSLVWNPFTIILEGIIACRL